MHGVRLSTIDNENTLALSHAVAGPPGIDRLAKGGMRFTDAYAPAGGMLT